MQLLVTVDGSEVGAGLPPEQAAQIREQLVGPSLEKLAQWEREGRIRGGILPGQRAGVWVVEAASPEEVDQLVASLPYWGVVKMQVQALMPVSGAIERNRLVSEQQRAAFG
jgi:hypothetical protein